MVLLKEFGVHMLTTRHDVSKLLWQSSPENPVNFQGRVFKLDKAYLQLKCHQKPHPPIYIGALGPKTRKLTGEIADGWITVASETPKTFNLHLEDVKRELAQREIQLEDFYVSATIYTEVGEFEEAYKIVESIARISLAMSKEIIELMGHKVEGYEKLSVQEIKANDAESIEKLKEISRTIPRKIVEQMVAVGKPDQCINRLEEYLKAGANSLIICSLSRNDDKLYQTYLEKIIPYMKETYGI